jgi:hypothetical protein
MDIYISNNVFLNGTDDTKNNYQQRLFNLHLDRTMSLWGILSMHMPVS